MRQVTTTVSFSSLTHIHILLSHHLTQLKEYTISATGHYKPGNALWLRDSSSAPLPEPRLGFIYGTSSGWVELAACQQAEALNWRGGEPEMVCDTHRPAADITPKIKVKKQSHWHAWRCDVLNSGHEIKMRLKTFSLKGKNYALVLFQQVSNQFW